MQKKIENTEATQVEEWTLGRDPNAIENQEKQGQAQLVASSQLPAKGLTPERAAQFGIEILGPSAGDPLFVDVRLPVGMEKRATGHDMWSELLLNGKKVAGIFYKAAYYDRCAFLSFED